MNKTVQDLKVETESIRKAQTEGNLERKDLGIQTGTSGASLTPLQQNTRDSRENLKHWWHDRINGYLGQKNIKYLKTHSKKHPGIWGHHEKTKPNNNRNKEGRRKPRSKAQKIFSTKSYKKISLTLRKEMPVKVQEAYKTPNRKEDGVGQWSVFCQLYFK